MGDFAQGSQGCTGLLRPPVSTARKKYISENSFSKLVLEGHFSPVQGHALTSNPLCCRRSERMGSPVREPCSCPVTGV